MGRAPEEESSSTLPRWVAPVLVSAVLLAGAVFWRSRPTPKPLPKAVVANRVPTPTPGPGPSSIPTPAPAPNPNPIADSKPKPFPDAKLLPDTKKVDPQLSLCKPHYQLRVQLLEKVGGDERWADITTIPGRSFSRTDPRYGYLGAGELRALVAPSGCPAGTVRDNLTVTWKVGDVGVPVPAVADALGEIVVPFKDMVTTGDYGAELFVNKARAGAVSFIVTK